MLLQSHGGVVRLLPALPKAWGTGSFRGLRARGGLEVDCAWSAGKIGSAKMKASVDGVVRMVGPGGSKVVRVKSGGAVVALREVEGGMEEFGVVAGKVYAVSFG